MPVVEKNRARTAIRSARPARTAPTASGRVRGSAASTLATRQRILDAAVKTLIESGHAQLSIRRVATLAGITVGNLTHHFPSKRGLMRAVIAHSLEHYSREMEEAFQKEGADPARRSQELVRWLIKDATTRRTSRLMRELWAMSLHDSHIDKEVSAFYDALLHRAAELLLRSRRDLDDRRATEIVHLLGLISEGATVLYGGARGRAVPLERILELTLPLLNGAAAAQPDTS